MNRKIIRGKRCYSKQQSEVQAEGLTFGEKELDEVLGNHISHILFDDEGTEHG